MIMVSRRSALKLGMGAIASQLLPSQRPALTAGADVAAPALRHPGLLHTAADFARMREKVTAGAEPWKSGWEKLIANPHASLKWKPRPAEIIVRGKTAGQHENYAVLFKDIASA